MMMMAMLMLMDASRCLTMMVRYVLLLEWCDCRLVGHKPVFVDEYLNECPEF
jgi:hypothetical protein